MQVDEYLATIKDALDFYHQAHHLPSPTYALPFQTGSSNNASSALKSTMNKKKRHISMDFDDENTLTTGTAAKRRHSPLLQDVGLEEQATNNSNSPLSIKQLLTTPSTLSLRQYMLVAEALESDSSRKLLHLVDDQRMLAVLTEHVLRCLEKCSFHGKQQAGGMLGIGTRLAVGVIRLLSSMNNS